MLLAAGSCLANLTRKNEYGRFYDNLADELKVPFLRYQLAMGVIQHRAESRIKPYLYTEHLLTPEGLGVPDRIFSNLEALNIPKGFSSHLYRLVTQDFGLNVLQVVHMIQYKDPCQETQSGCWDLGDVGSNCC